MLLIIFQQLKYNIVEMFNYLFLIENEDEININKHNKNKFNKQSSINDIHYRALIYDSESSEDEDHFKYFYNSDNSNSSDTDTDYCCFCPIY